MMNLNEKTKIFLLGILLGVVGTLVIVNIFDLTSSQLENQPLQQLDVQTIEEENPDLPSSSPESSPSVSIDQSDLDTL